GLIGTTVTPAMSAPITAIAVSIAGSAHTATRRHPRMSSATSSAASRNSLHVNDACGNWNAISSDARSTGGNTACITPRLYHAKPRHAVQVHLDVLGECVYRPRLECLPDMTRDAGDERWTRSTTTSATTSSRKRATTSIAV